MPERIQRQRTAGWRMPEGAIYVGRPSKWGNPFRWQDQPTWTGRYLPDGEIDDDPRRIPDETRRRWSVTDFAAAVQLRIGRQADYPSLAEIRAELAGRDLACWCKPDQPCHADVLLELANGATS